MSRACWRPDPGWLLYSGDGTMFGGNVAHLNLTVEVPAVSVTSISGGGYVQYAPGPPDITVTATLSTLTRDDTTWHGDPPDLKALMALARRHPEEYAELREGEQILKALGG